MGQEKYDAIIIGGGPAGATAAIAMAQAGHHVTVLDRSEFPRFRIGESLVPKVVEMLMKLGLTDLMDEVVHVPKRGVEIGFGNQLGEQLDVAFANSLRKDVPRAFNAERGSLDGLLLEAAKKEGVEVRNDFHVKEITRLEDQHVIVTNGNGEQIEGQFLIDASGQATVVGRHLGIRKIHPEFRSVSYFSHFEGVQRLSGDRIGDPSVIMCDEGWFWIIPIDQNRTSVGVVFSDKVARSLPVPPNQRLNWALERCPLMTERMVGASGPDHNEVVADFSYQCEPVAGPGYFLIGDAAAFVDPVFSTGVMLGMDGGLAAAAAVTAISQGQSVARVRRQFVRHHGQVTSLLFRLIKDFYSHSFRELLVAGHGPLAMHRALIELLAGYVSPRPSLNVRWRYTLFRLCVHLNRHVPLVPRQERFSLLETSPQLLQINKTKPLVEYGSLVLDS